MQQLLCWQGLCVGAAQHCRTVVAWMQMDATPIARRVTTTATGEVKLQALSNKLFNSFR